MFTELNRVQDMNDKRTEVLKAALLWCTNKFADLDRHDLAIEILNTVNNKFEDLMEEMESWKE